ncbi:MAG: hypothetical protein RR690_06345, partial [Longicatena sp.]
MACFIVPAVEAAVVSVIGKGIEHYEKKNGGVSSSGYTTASCFIRKRKWLSRLLWGGSALLAFEHLWHGEIIPYYPFLTAAYSAKDTMIMLKEMSTVGVCMAGVVTIA